MRNKKRVESAKFSSVTDRTWEQKFVNHIHRQGVEELAVMLSQAVHRPLQVRYLGPAHAATDASFERAVSVRVKLGSLGLVRMIVERSLAASLVDLMVGGTGDREEGPFTDLEAVLVRRLLTAFPAVLPAWWDEVVQLAPEIQEIRVSNAAHSAETSAGMAVAYEAQYGVSTGQLKVVYEAQCLSRLLKQASHVERPLRPDPSHEGEVAADVSDQLDDVRVSISARLGLLRLTMRELLELETGDILITDALVGANVPVFVEGRLKFMASPGRKGGQLAVRVVESMERGVTKNA